MAAWLLLALAALVGGAPSPARASAASCVGVLPASAPREGALRIRCPLPPGAYRDGVLWLRLDVPAHARRGSTMVVRATRVDRLDVVFGYADGSRETLAAAGGAFGRRWHVGSEITFPARPGATLSAAWLRAERLQDYDLLRVRFIAADEIDRQFELAAALIGAALGLLGVAALYNLGMARAVRRPFFLWHGMWAAAVLCWGLVWSQLALVVAPGMAGSIASRLSTVLACLAMMFAAASAISALRASLARTTRQGIAGLAVAVLVLGLVSTWPRADLAIVGPLLSIGVLLTLATVTTAAIVAWRRGRRDARDLLIAWAIPMLMLGATQLFEFRDGLFGGGPQIAVLFASAFQTICLSAIATFRLNSLRLERDAAIAQGNALTELAERDPLTTLLNRRGFVSRCEAAFDGLPEAPFGLLLIDVDNFKRVNDRFGHEAGDAVLVRLAAALRLLERIHLCYAGRMGGEEFVLGVSGLPAIVLLQFAEHVRAVMGACDHGAALHGEQVTVSIGVAQGLGSGPFPALYARADRALYEAKGLGRDRVVFPGFVPTAEGQLSLSLGAGDVSPMPR